MKEKITFIALLFILVLTALALVITCAYALNHAYAADEGFPFFCGIIALVAGFYGIVKAGTAVLKRFYNL